MSSMPRQKPDIHKAAAIIIEDGKLLVARTHGKDVFVAPGGKLEDDESPEEALIRELSEELAIKVDQEYLSLFGTFYAIAAGSENLSLRMDVFLVDHYAGKISKQAEIAEIAWVDSDIPEGMKVGSIFEKEVIPRLKNDGEIN